MWEIGQGIQLWPKWLSWTSQPGNQITATGRLVWQEKYLDSWSGDDQDWDRRCIHESRWSQHKRRVKKDIKKGVVKASLKGCWSQKGTQYFLPSSCISFPSIILYPVIPLVSPICTSDWSIYHTHVLTKQMFVAKVVEYECWMFSIWNAVQMPGSSNC